MAGRPSPVQRFLRTALHLHRRSSVEIPAWDIVSARIKVIQTATDAAWRVFVEQVVYAQREAEIVGKAWGGEAQLHVGVKAGIELVVCFGFPDTFDVAAR